jgi:hypothetical protein
MSFQKKTEQSKSFQKALKRAKKLNLEAANLPSAHELDYADTKEKKTFKSLASAILRLQDPQWWATLPRTSQAEDVFSFLLSLRETIKIQVEILSSPFDEESIRGKEIWCHKNLPAEVFGCYHIRGDKETFASDETILLDDRLKVVNKFNEGGGHGVWFTNTNGWKEKIKTLVKEGNIKTIYIDLDGVVVNNHSSLINCMQNLLNN